MAVAVETQTAHYDNNERAQKIKKEKKKALNKTSHSHRTSLNSM